MMAHFLPSSCLDVLEFVATVVDELVAFGELEASPCLPTIYTHLSTEII